MFSFSTNESGINDERKSKKAEIITIASGKGGVGKTLFSVNTAIECALLGKKTLLIDADLGLANVHIMTGIYPDFDLMDVVNNKKSIQEVIVEGPGGIHIIPGASGIFQLSNISHQKRQTLVDQLNKLETDYDVIIVDAEAGLSHNVLKFISIADRAVIITTPDLTALSDAYAIIKVIRLRKSNENIGVVINRARSINEADTVYKKLSMATEKFLSYKLIKYGFILEDAITVKESIQTRKPIAVQFPKTKVGASLKNVVYELFKVEAKKVVEPNIILNRFSMLLENIRTRETV
ncbi:MAG: MinD/ParA family protein [Candidatus Margulisbacteria bacterium]|nr:MinD/ParA family protein [Candidatus Margulisiibacteriota bacterium]